MADEDDEARANERVGSVLDDKWTLERLLGMGGMAAVYVARHRNGARAAVKLLHPQLARHEQVRVRFRREGYAANKVEHRGTVQVLDDDTVKDGPDAGAAYLVMELLEGESLDARSERTPKLTGREVLEIMAQVLDVLEAAHARGVIHRDLKPENLFLTRDDAGAMRVKVLDFGLARVTEAAPVTVEGLALGTPDFMSPEQAGGRIEEIDGRTDLFALGATAFLLLAGRPIHEGRTVIEVVLKMGGSPAPAIRAVAPDVPEPVARVIDRALQFRREDRYADAPSMRADVEAALRQLAPSASDATVEVAVPSRPAEKPGRRSSTPWLVLVLFLGAGAGVTFFAWPHLGELGRRIAPESASNAAVTDAGRALVEEDASGSLAASAEAMLDAAAPGSVASSASDAAAASTLAPDASTDAGQNDDDDEEDDAGAGGVVASAGSSTPSGASTAPPRPHAKPPAPKKKKKKPRPKPWVH